MGRVRVMLSIVAALAAIAATSAVAQASPYLRIEANGIPLAAGASLKTSSSNIVLQTTSGEIECETVALYGSVTNNDSVLDNVAISSVEATGDFDSTPGACKTSDLGPAIVKGENLPWTLSLSGLGEAGIADRPAFTFTLPSDGGLECTLETAKIGGGFETGGPISIKLKGANFVAAAGDNPSCPTSGLLSGGTLTVTSDGVAVTGIRQANSETGTVTGVVTGAGDAPIAHAKVAACSEEYEEEDEVGETPICYAGETGTSGTYAIAGVPVGLYYVEVTPPAHSGYGLTSAHGLLVEAQAMAVENLELLGDGSVSGTVTDPSSAPVEHAAVEACSEDQGEPEPQPAVCYTAETEAGGEYSLPEVRTGKYEITVTPAAHSGLGNKKTSSFAVAVGGAVTENVALTEAGQVTGTVTSPHGEPVSGAYVWLCNETQLCDQAVTDSSGSYTIEDVADGSYDGSVSPPEGYDSATSTSPVVVSGSSTTTQNYVVSPPTPIPSGTNVASNLMTTVGGLGVPVANWQEEVPITTEACVGGDVTATITGTNVHTETEQTTGSATLIEQGTGSGTFDGRLPEAYPIHGVVTVKITVKSCHESSEEKTSEFTMYYDPSGTVVDGDDSDAPLPGATVVLLSSVSRTGPFTAVPNGSNVMSPANRVNPFVTGPNGEFAWDTAPGFYRVKASEAGCGTASTATLTVPPPVFGLKLVLHCQLRIDTASAPEVTPGSAYETQLQASGIDPPFKWKKLGTLPKGLKLSKTGLLHGTIKPGKVAAATYTIGVQVKDAKKHTTTANISVKVY